MNAVSSAVDTTDRRPKVGKVWSLPAWGLGVFWIVVGAMKIGLLVRDATAGSYLAEFPVLVIGCVAVGEIVIGLAIIAGRERAGLVSGVLLLGVLCIVLVVRPIPAGVPCGCTGVVGVDATSTATTIWRNGLLVALHLLALVCLAPAQRSG